LIGTRRKGTGRTISGDRSSLFEHGSLMMMAGVDFVLVTFEKFKMFKLI